MARRLAALLVPIFAGHMLAQAPGKLSFEVATIKPNTSLAAPFVGGAGGPSIGVRGHHFAATNASLRDIIRYAYRLETYQGLEGGPRWVDDRFDITAVIPDTAPVADAHLMLRTLLAERFKLSVRRVPKEQSIYALAVARRDGRLGPALKRSATDCAKLPAPVASAERQLEPVCDMAIQPFRARLLGNARTMADLARLLSRVQALGAPVLDRTRLDGVFDFDVTFSPERPGADAPRGPGDPPSLFVALEEQLGLRLERTRGTVDVLTIERLEPLAKE